jgi:hypothetical protein
MGAFVSYSSRDNEAVTRLTQDLQHAEEQVWLDQRLAGGDAWWRAILDQIRGCDVFIFALSQYSIQSKPCLAELHYAQGLGLPILPIQVGPVDSMQLNPLATVQTVDYRASTSAAGMRLLSALHRAQTQRQPLPSPLPAEPPVPFEYLIRLYTTIAGTDQLSPRDQAALVTQLEFGLREDGDHDAARSDILVLLTKLRDREDVTYRTRTDVDAILASIDAGTHLERAPQPLAPTATNTHPVSPGSPSTPAARSTGPEVISTSAITQARGDNPPPYPTTPKSPSRRRGTATLIGMAAIAFILIAATPILIWASWRGNYSGTAYHVLWPICIAVAAALIVAIVAMLVRRRSAFAQQPRPVDWSAGRSTPLDDDRPLTKRIPDYLRAHPHSTAATIAEALGSSKDSISSTLSELKKRGEVNNAVDGRTTREWVAVNTF